MKTIIQALPTIYGEAVNGSVLGQPNGSIARPPQNFIGTITLSGDSVIVTYTGRFPMISPEFAYYKTAGLTIDCTVTSFDHAGITVYDSSDNVVCGILSQGSYIPSTSGNLEGLIGDYANKPTNGDTLSLVVTVYDVDNNIIVQSSAISCTAVVS